MLIYWRVNVDHKPLFGPFWVHGPILLGLKIGRVYPGFSPLNLPMSGPMKKTHEPSYPHIQVSYQVDAS